MNNFIINQLIGPHRLFVNVETLWTMHETEKLEIYSATHCGNHPIRIDLTTGFYNNTKMLANVSTRAFVTAVNPVSRGNAEYSFDVLSAWPHHAFRIEISTKKSWNSKISEHTRV